VCPNDANFSIDTPPEEIAFDDLVVDGAGRVERLPAAGLWKVGKPHQWANYADACNECGNCDVFCPEDGGPYVVKARFFGSLKSLDASPKLDGMFIDEADHALRVRARLGGRRYVLTVQEDNAVLDDGKLRVE